MGSLLCPSLILLLSLMVSLISPTYSVDCSSLKIAGGKKEYSNCIQLPTLKSTLHFTYDAKNSSLSVAFSAAPPKPDGWVAWGVNPTGMGMQGAQALLAFKDKGSVVVKTYNISNYMDVAEGKLSFEVWDLEAEAGNDGKTVIYGSVKVPAGAEKVNQVWQVGPVFDGQPGKHESGTDNLGSKGELKLVEKASSGSSDSSPAQSPTLTPPAANNETSAASTPQAAKNSAGDGWRVREINAGLWSLGLVSLLVLM
ncbi:hypothetical protein PTKIN_Ptkin15bG0142000 [Pterospermum kingtungense]